MAKLIDDPAVQALVKKHLDAAVKKTTKEHLAHLKTELDSFLENSGSSGDKRLIRGFHALVKSRIKDNSAEAE